MGFTSENLITNTAAVASSLVNLSPPLLQEICPKRTRQLAPPPPVQYHLWVPLTFLFEKREKIGYNIALSQAEVWSK